MRRRISVLLLALGLALSLLAAACQGEEVQPTSTPTPGSTAGSGTGEGHQGDAQTPVPTATVETKVCDGECIGPIVAAMDILDSTGFHGMSEEIGGADSMGVVNPAYLGKVEHAIAVASAAPWYGELSGQADTFTQDARALASALESGDLEAAKEAIQQVHESHHDLGHETYEWLGTLSKVTGNADAVMAVQDVIDTTGFHGMSEEIEAAESMKDVNPRFLGKAKNALIAAEVVEWPGALREPADAFIADVTALTEGLESGDLEAAKEAIHGIHSSQHELSQETFAWLEGQQGTEGAGAVMAAQDIIDSTGYHHLTNKVSDAGSMADVDPGILGKVRKSLIAARAVRWDDSVKEHAEAFMQDAEALASALESGDLEAAKEAAHSVHSTQHELSQMAFNWLGGGAEAVQAEKYANAPVVKMEVRDWEWDPTTVTLEQGQPVVIEVTNTGEMPHGIWIPELGINVATPPGEVTRVGLTPEKSGEFYLGCNNPMCGTGEQHSSMVASVVVSEPVAAGEEEGHEHAEGEGHSDDESEASGAGDSSAAEESAEEEAGEEEHAATEKEETSGETAAHEHDDDEAEAAAEEDTGAEDGEEDTAGEAHESEAAADEADEAEESEGAGDASDEEAQTGDSEGESESGGSEPTGFVGLLNAALEALEAGDREEAVSLVEQAAAEGPSAHQQDEAREAAYRIRTGNVDSGKGLVEHLISEAQ